jgi:hypothetical protein
VVIAIQKLSYKANCKIPFFFIMKILFFVRNWISMASYFHVVLMLDECLFHVNNSNTKFSILLNIIVFQMKKDQHQLINNETQLVPTHWWIGKPCIIKIFPCRFSMEEHGVWTKFISRPINRLSFQHFLKSIKNGAINQRAMPISTTLHDV